MNNNTNLSMFEMLDILEALRCLESQWVEKGNDAFFITKSERVTALKEKVTNMITKRSRELIQENW